MSSSGLIRVLTADDHALLRKGIAGLVNDEPDMKMVAEAGTGAEAIKQFRQHRPDITLMDLQMPDMSGIEAIIGIRSEFPEARIIVLTTYTGDVQVVRALKAGALGYLAKARVNRDLVEVIRAVYAGKKRIPPEIATELAEHAGEEDLSPRELEVLGLIARGNANKEIAARLAITEETVKSHIRRILDKLRANDRTHAVTIALKRGIHRLLRSLKRLVAKSLCRTFRSCCSSLRLLRGLLCNDCFRPSPTAGRAEVFSHNGYC